MSMAYTLCACVYTYLMVLYEVWRFTLYLKIDLMAGFFFSNCAHKNSNVWNIEEPQFGH